MLNLSEIRALKISLSLKFILGCSLTLIIALGTSFYVISQRQERLLMGQIENEARIIFKQIVITRSWIADHGGIFIEKLPWSTPSPYMKDPEMKDIKGKRYLKQTPAMVTKELSKYAKGKGFYWFHITSLKLMNPENAPDEFEKKALSQFEESNAKELISIETTDNSKYLRYISPLYVETACLKCHSAQGYKVGDVRGAISITIPMDKTFAEISANKQNMLIAVVLTVLALMSAMFLMMKNLVLTPMEKLQASIKEFSEGKYSPDKMLKTGDEFEELCLSFSDMAGKLTEYHNSLNEKIRVATKDLAETNTKLIEANIRKSDFIARASHELRTPLTSIKGAMDYISTKFSRIAHERQDDASRDDLIIFFEMIKKNSERLINMVNTMLDLERIELGVSELHLSDTNLSHLIEETLISLQVNADEKDILLSADLPDNLSVYADEEKIRRVLINLISNAIKFSPNESEIVIKSYADGDYITTEICDEGPGIPISEQDRIFDKFYKSGNKEGAGLGLAICKSIIETHNGIISLKSNGTSGSCFYFKLPKTETPQTPGNNL